METPLKLNLGCGKNTLEGYLNVDKFGEPDLQHDLETFPWPWPDNSVDEIVLNHVLEHLGATTDIYFGIIKEIHRICQPGATLHIAVPHPRHDDFINDPTHVRAVTPSSLKLFSKRMNQHWIDGGYANSPLAFYLDVDFEITDVKQILDAAWSKKVQDNEVSQNDLAHAARTYNNVVSEYRITLTVKKRDTPGSD